MGKRCNRDCPRRDVRCRIGCLDFLLDTLENEEIRCKRKHHNEMVYFNLTSEVDRKNQQFDRRKSKCARKKISNKYVKSQT